MAKVVAEVGSTANRYQILARLAAGGMAEIFLARGASVAGVERYCVLKRILREHASDAQFVQMFLDEARLAAQLQHPNIASVYDVGMLGDSYFFTMEYVHGETLRSLAERAQELHRPLPLACVLTIIAGTAAGLHHAHERNANDGRPLGIVHRDVSPANVMVSFEGNVKVVDFGVAKAANRAVETQSGTVKGKISYLSPEQCRGIRVDRRSDLFSLGIVMWEMLTGARLYRRASDFDNMTAIAHELPPPPSSRRPEIPRTVDDIVLRLLAKSLTARFQTAAEVLEAIEDASMRARTILSTSAVSRLVRDLFGMRAEPWLELEGDTLPQAAVTLMSRPVPPEPGLGLPDGVDAALASVRNLSSSSLSGETHEVPVPVAQPWGEPRPQAVVPVATASREPITTHPTPAPFSANHASNTTLLGAGAPPPSPVVPYSTVFAPPGRLFAQVAPPARIAMIAVPLPLVTDIPPPSCEPTGSQPRLMQYPSADSSSSLAPTQRRAGSPPASSIAWPLITVIVMAAAIGVLVVWLAMKDPPVAVSHEGASLGAAPVPIEDASVIGASDALHGVGPVAASASARRGPDGAEIELLENDAATPEAVAQRNDPPVVGHPDAAAVAISGPVRDAASSAPPRAASSATETPRAEASPRPRRPADAGPTHRPPSEESPPPASAPANRIAPAPEPLAQLPLPSPPAGESMPVWLSQLYHQADYAAIVQVCSGTKVTEDIANVCVLAACQDHAPAKAKSWLSRVAKTSRDTAAARCKDLCNIDLQSN